MLNSWRTSLAVIAGLVVSQAVAGEALAAKRALLVGIGKYMHLNDLQGPDVDIRNFEKFLIEREGFASDEISILQNERATRANILTALEHWLVGSTKPGDKVVFYYSGHGGQVRDTDGDEQDGLDETLAPFDTDENQGNQITDDEFSAVLARLSDRDVTVIFDSCHSGTISRGSAPASGGEFSPRTYFPTFGTRGEGDVAAHRKEESFVPAGAGLRIWSAASANQYAWGNANGGIFTNFFLEGAGRGLADRNGNGVITNAEMLAFLRARTKDWCDRYAGCTLGFTPTLEADASEMGSRISVGTPPGGGFPSQPVKPVKPVTQTAPVKPVAPPEPTDLVVADNSADISIEIVAKSPLRVGDEVKFRVTSKRKGWLILVDVNARGEVTQLVPNDIMKANGKWNEISAGRPVTLPDAYYGFSVSASGPAGKGTLLAIVTEDPVDVTPLLEQNGAFDPVKDPRAYLSELVFELTRTWTQARINRGPVWSRAVLEYEIRP